MSNKTIQSLRGMKDIVNQESKLFTYLPKGFSRIRLTRKWVIHLIVWEFTH